MRSVFPRHYRFLPKIRNLASENRFLPIYRAIAVWPFPDAKKDSLNRHRSAAIIPKIPNNPENPAHKSCFRQRPPQPPNPPPIPTAPPERALIPKIPIILKILLTNPASDNAHRNHPQPRPIPTNCSSRARSPIILKILLTNPAPAPRLTPASDNARRKSTRPHPIPTNRSSRAR